MNKKSEPFHHNFKYHKPQEPLKRRKRYNSLQGQLTSQFFHKRPQTDIFSESTNSMTKEVTQQKKM